MRLIGQKNRGKTGRYVNKEFGEGVGPIIIQITMDNDTIWHVNHQHIK
jgi:hypothetical protein